MYCRECGNYLTYNEMICNSCGFNPTNSDKFCQGCGNTTKSGQEMCVNCNAMLVKNDSTNLYAGFWLRLGAFILDGLIISVPIGIFMMLYLTVTTIGMTSESEAGEPSDLEALIFIALLIGIYIFYYAGLLATPWQATPGKKLVGIKVTDREGNRISFLRAVWRLIAMSFSGMIIYIGYIMIGFTSKKQGLHDFIASTIVVKSK